MQFHPNPGGEGGYHGGNLKPGPQIGGGGSSRVLFSCGWIPISDPHTHARSRVSRPFSVPSSTTPPTFQKTWPSRNQDQLARATWAGQACAGEGGQRGHGRSSSGCLPPRETKGWGSVPPGRQRGSVARVWAGRACDPQVLAAEVTADPSSLFSTRAHAPEAEIRTPDPAAPQRHANQGRW